MFRVFEIRRTISEGVAATVRDPEMAYRLGSRAVPSLLLMLEDETISGEQCKNVIEALAVLREPSACESILDRFDDDELRSTAIAAMVSIGHLPPLLDGDSSSSENEWAGSQHCVNSRYLNQFLAIVDYFAFRAG